jgi:putative transposase
VTGYRRNFVAAGSFFFTVNLAERRLRPLTDDVADEGAHFGERT